VLEIFYRRKGDVRGQPEAPHLVVAQPGDTHATLWCASLLAPLRLSFGLCLVSGKIGGSGFISSNSKNISYVTFLKHKIAENRELALWHLVNRLVPENA
jgi:hypothetical protein